MRVPGMLIAKVARSTVAHGRIVSIDTSAALKVKGVFAVYTGEDIRKVIPEPYYGPAFHDQPILALGKVRHVGEPVAVALARDAHVAEQAAQLVEVVYEELPAVFDEVEAMDSKAIVHDVLKPAGTFPDLKHLHGKKNTNIALDFHLKRGDVDGAFASAAHVFEHEFHTQQVMHTPLEPMVSLAEPTRDGLTIHTASQSPSFVRIEIARLLGWPENKVQVKVPYLGGGFGAKLYIKLEAMVAALALLTKRPVKWSLTMEEQFYTISKHATTFRIKSAVDVAGKITGRSCAVYWNGGAYADIGPRVTQKSGFTAPGPYDIENVAIESYSLYTNRPPAGALRGFGIPQLVWAYESHTDLIARELEYRPGGIPPQEYPAGRPPAGDRHRDEGRSDRSRPGKARRADELVRAVRSRQWNGAPRSRCGDRIQGLDLADDVGCLRQYLRRRQLRALHEHGGHGAGLRHRDGADRRRSAAGASRERQGDSSRHRRHALRHGDAGLAVDLSHGQRGETGRRGREAEA